MILTVDGISISRCNIASFAPEDIKQTFQMMDGSRSVDIIGQTLSVPFTYGVMKSVDLAVIMNIWKTKSAHTVSYTDYDGTAVSFSAYMSPPQYVKKRSLVDGTWLIGQCTFQFDKL